MYYYYYKETLTDLWVYIEEVNRKEGTVLFDFIDVIQLNSFRQTLNFDHAGPSMVLLRNYQGKIIRENTIYEIPVSTIRNWQQRNLISSDRPDSFLIGYSIDLGDINEPVFAGTISLNKEPDFARLALTVNGGGDNSQSAKFGSGAAISITVRDVGQGNWNEININGATAIVFDSGAPMNAGRAEISHIIRSRNQAYPFSKPILVLSHWDKDHYHALIGMSDAELQNNFSAFICRDRVPNTTSKKLFHRISNAVGALNTYTIAANSRINGPVVFTPEQSLANGVTLYNAQQHKNRNISGLALAVKTAQGSIILSGDAHYEQISRDILPDLGHQHTHHLVVPHHGGKAGDYRYTLPRTVVAGHAVISVGDNRYGHPFRKYITSLMSGGFHIRQTQIISGDITIAL